VDGQVCAKTAVQIAVNIVASLDAARRRSFADASAADVVSRNRSERTPIVY
jgi:hypothetical protein